MDDLPDAIAEAASLDDAELLQLPVDWASAADECLAVDSMDCVERAEASNE